jgi:hypothetical protein
MHPKDSSKILKNLKLRGIPSKKFKNSKID